MNERASQGRVARNDKSMAIGWALRDVGHIEREAQLKAKGAEAMKRIPRINSALYLSVHVSAGSDAHRVIHEVVRFFLTQEEAMLEGEFDAELVSRIDCAKALDNVLSMSKKQVYTDSGVLEIEAAGFEVLGGLLGYFVPALQDVCANGESASARSKKYFQLLPEFVRTKVNNERLTSIDNFFLLRMLSRG